MDSNPFMSCPERALTAFLRVGKCSGCAGAPVDKKGRLGVAQMRLEEIGEVVEGLVLSCVAIECQIES
jgi:hypothetical protein